LKRLSFLLLFLFTRPAFAAITDPQVLQEKTVVVHFSTTVPASANPSAFVLVSLSTPTGFPHNEHGELDVSHINIVIDKLAASTGTVKIGVVNFVNTSTGSVTFFWSRSFLKNVSNTDVTDFHNFSLSFVRCKVNSGATAAVSDKNGTTPYITSNDVRNGSSIYSSTNATVSQLNSPAGIISPGVGDIVMEVVNGDSANTINVVTDVYYHSER